MKADQAHFRDGCSMSRALAIACAASASALAYAAHATSNPNSVTSQFEVKGTISPYCTIQNGSKRNAPSFTSGDPVNTVYTDSGISVLFRDFGDANGNGNELYGQASLHVLSNARCDYTLKSTYGALKNQTSDTAFRPYWADVYEGSSSGNLVYLDHLTSNRDVNKVETIATSKSAMNIIQIEVYVEQSGKLVPGDYEDILSLTISPQN